VIATTGEAPSTPRPPGDEVGDARTVLTDAHAVPSGNAREAVGHVRRPLFVRHRYEADARRREDIEGIHVRGADDAEHVGDALRHQVSTKASEAEIFACLHDHAGRFGVGHLVLLQASVQWLMYLSTGLASGQVQFETAPLFRF
jgi:hypothetical protein